MSLNKKTTNLQQNLTLFLKKYIQVLKSVKILSKLVKCTNEPIITLKLAKYGFCMSLVVRQLTC